QLVIMVLLILIQAYTLVTLSFLFFLLIPLLPRSTLFPYTTLFRSGGTAYREFRQSGPRGGHTADSVVDLRLVSGKLLAQSDGRGVHQVGPSGLDDRIEFLCLLREAVLQLTQGRQQALVDFQQGRDVDRRRDDVVRGLARVHVIIRMDGALLPQRMAQDLVRAVRDHLVRIHVRRGPAAGLEDV